MRETGKFRSVRGFTLVEMLIVVAIIAILVAVSIPLVNTSLEKARDATDQANERAAKAEATIVYLVGEDEALRSAMLTDGVFYNAVNGQLLQSSDARGMEPYGKCTQPHENEHLFMSVAAADDSEDVGPHNGLIIMVKMDENGEIKLMWFPPPK